MCIDVVLGEAEFPIEQQALDRRVGGGDGNGVLDVVGHDHLDLASLQFIDERAKSASCGGNIFEVFAHQSARIASLRLERDTI